MNIQPFRDLVLIKVDPVKEQTSSGIFIKEDWKSLPQTGTVIAIGPEVLGPKPKDRVMFDRYGAIIVDKELRLCQERSTYATI